MSTLQNQLALVEREDVARAVRGLLRTPWVTQATDPALYEVVRQRHVAVRKWFEYYPGWNLILQPEQGYARLLKTPGDRVAPDDLRPARRQRSGSAPFDRLRYVLLCVVAAEALDVRMVTLGELADRVALACAADDLLPAFRSDRLDHRRVFVDVLITLEGWGAFTTIDGQTQGYAEDAHAAVLYRVNPQSLHNLLACAQGPSLVLPDDVEILTAIAAITDETGYGPSHRESGRLPAATDGDPARPTSAQRSRWARHSVLRRLFDDAVLYRDDLNEAELAYTSSITGREVLRRAVEISGFVLEERAEGILLVDPDRASGPDAFPAAGAASAAALHLITGLLGAGNRGVTPQELAEHLATLMDSAPAWARSYREDGGPSRLTREALDLLAGHQLVARSGGRVFPRPAASRYREVVIARPSRRRSPAEAVEQESLPERAEEAS